MRMLGFIRIAVILLSIFAVSYENEFWNFWGEEKAARYHQPTVQSERLDPDPNEGKSFAHAMPVGKSPSDIAEDVDGYEESDGNAEPVQKAEDEKKDSYVGKSSNSGDDAAMNENPATSEPVSSAPIPAKHLLTNPDEQGQSRASEGFVEEKPTAGADIGTQEKQKPVNESPKEGHMKDFESEADNYEMMEEEDNNESQYHYKSQRISRAKTFIVVFMGHSGSTAFTTELRAHTEFEVELLEPLEHGQYQGNTELALKKARELMDRGIAKGTIPGFKIRPFHINNMPEKWRDFAQEYDTRVIWQYRENVVKQAVGEYRHRFLNDTSVVEGLGTNEEPCAKGSKQKCRIKISNMRGLHGLMNDFSGSDELLASAVRILRRDNDVSIVRYEDYLYRRERTMREAFDFLGVDYQDTAPQRQKASPDNLCEMVSNFQELCDHFLGCQLWRPYLHDDVNNCRCKPGSWKTFDSTYCRRSAWYQSKD